MATKNTPTNIAFPVGTRVRYLVGRGAGTGIVTGVSEDLATRQILTDKNSATVNRQVASLTAE